jgi:hypothetical protein
MYMAEELDCAFIETFDRDKFLNVVAWSEIERRGVARVESASDLRLVDLSGPGLRRIGADGRLATTDDYPLTQRWSRTLHDHPNAPHGIQYRSRHDPSLTSVALFERAQAAITVTHLGSLADPGFLDQLMEILNRYEFALV